MSHKRELESELNSEEVPSQKRFRVNDNLIEYSTETKDGGDFVINQTWNANTNFIDLFDEYEMQFKLLINEVRHSAANEHDLVNSVIPRYLTVFNNLSTQVGKNKTTTVVKKPKN